MRVEPSSIIKDCDIIIVGQQPWDVKIGSNCKNIALEFSKHNRVLYINSPLDRKTQIKKSYDPEIKMRVDVVKKKISGLNQIQTNLWVYYPDEIIESINRIKISSIYNFFNKINNKRFARSIQKAITQLGFKDFILFNDNDIFRCFYLKELLKPVISIYYSRDYLLTVDYWKLHGRLLEPQLIAKSDLCLANSVYLTNYCKQYNKNSFYVGQGCDIDSFTHYKGNSPTDIPTDKPIIGYVGALQSIRLDIELIKYIAQHLPQYNVVLVGSEDEAFKESSLHHIKNIYFTGNRPLDMMPAYIKAFDVCLNPQIINEVTIGNYPRKIDEYLAMGKPVVATHTEAMDIFKDHVYLSKNYKDTILCVKKAIDENTMLLQQQRIKFAETHTWGNNVKEIYKAIVDVKTSNKIANKTILVFSNMRFDSPIEAASLFLARNFARNNLVYYIEYPTTIKDYIGNKNSGLFMAMKKSFFYADKALLDTNIPNFKKLILPIIAPINFLPEGKIFRLFLKINEYAILKRIKKVLKNKGINDLVFINSFNFHYPDIGNGLKPSLNIYQCVDPMIIPYDMKHGITSELQLVKESDMVICTSKALYEEKSKINKNTYFVPNAADLSHSSKALDKDLPIHPILEKIPKPIIGYFGSIERRIDFDLMQSVIYNNPDKSFVFAGPYFAEHIPGWFFNTPNVYLPGPVPYEEMPQMLKGFDIAIIPFKKDDVSATIFPLKLFEYLGAAKPVVITDFNPDLKDYTFGAVSFCSDAASFDKAVNDILVNDDAEKQAKRLSVARKNTWEIRADEIMALIEKGLEQKD